MKVLTFTTLYPNAAQPQHGIFVENRLRALVASGAVEARVLAPVPWFPFASARFGRYAAFARAPRAETRHGIAVAHPRFPVVPKLGMTLAPGLLYRAAARALRAMIAAGARFDLIDAHYFYPDGVAAARLGRAFGLPVVITGRGTDLNLIPRKSAIARRMIRSAAEDADGLIVVAEALKRRLADLGVPESRIAVLRNGVDLDLFRPMDRKAARARLGLEGPLVVSVGNLVPLKGHDLVIEALRDLPDFRLAIAGSGPEERALRSLAERLGVAARVRFLGALAHEALPALYAAADALVLASSREGWPNVLMEAMACGVPVVATRVGGAPEIVADPAAGRLVETRSAEAIADGVRALLAAPPARDATRSYAERFGWEETTQGQIALFERILAHRRRAE